MRDAGMGTAFRAPHATAGLGANYGDSFQRVTPNFAKSDLLGVKLLYRPLLHYKPIYKYEMLRIRAIRSFPSKIFRKFTELKLKGQVFLEVQQLIRLKNSTVADRKVVEDEVQIEDDLPVIWEQREKDVLAEEARIFTNPGFSFSAAGLLFPYHLGVCQRLLEQGYITENTPVAGSSAGAIVCAVLAVGMPMQEALDATKELALDCRTYGTAFRLGAVLRKVLEKVMPEDAHIKASGRIRVAITQLFTSPRGVLVDKFESKEDLINAILTSSFIPGYLAPRPVTIFKNRICIDGGFTLFMPPIAAEVTVRVCAFSAQKLGIEDIGISPDCNPQNAASPSQLLKWALEPAEDEILDQLFYFGYEDAKVWTHSNPLSNFRVPDTNGCMDSLPLFLITRKLQ